MADWVENDPADGIDRRGFLKCMAWAGTGLVWSFTGGVLRSEGLSRLTSEAGEARFDAGGVGAGGWAPAPYHGSGEWSLRLSHGA